MTHMQSHPQRWDDWIAEACGAFGIDPEVVDVTAIHGLAKVVAHEFERPMAPVSSFVLGWALARDPELDVQEARNRIEATVPEAQAPAEGDR